jgi:hypothetical protein
VSRLVLDPNFEQADAFYAALIDAHRDLDDAASAALNARLVLLLANQIGDQEALCQAIALARASAVEIRNEQVD